MRRAGDHRCVKAKQQPAQRANCGGLEKIRIQAHRVSAACAAGLVAKRIRTVLISYGFVDTLKVLPCKGILLSCFSMRSVSEAACAPAGSCNFTSVSFPAHS